MTTARQRGGSTAAGVALGAVVACILSVGLPAEAAPNDTYAGRAGYMSTQDAAAAYPNPQYPNHKPLRGNYPGSYTTTPSTPVQRQSSGFDWLAAGVGAAGMSGVILLLTAGRAAGRVARGRKDAIPFVIDVRDNTPSVR
jgi:hypothetical protein